MEEFGLKSSVHVLEKVWSLWSAEELQQTGTSHSKLMLSLPMSPESPRLAVVSAMMQCGSYAVVGGESMALGFYPLVLRMRSFIPVSTREHLPAQTLLQNINPSRSVEWGSPRDRWSPWLPLLPERQPCSPPPHPQTLWGRSGTLEEYPL